MFKEENIATAFLAVMLMVVPTILLSIPVIGWQAAGVTQKALNQQCATNYTQWEVYITGSDLTELCRIKQQELLIKQ